MKEDLEESLRIAENTPDLSEIGDRQKVAIHEHIRLAQETFQTTEHQQWGAQIAITTNNADSLTALVLQFRSRKAH